MREPSQSLILNSILHPIKFVWRFVVLYHLVYFIIGLISQQILNSFLFQTKMGDNIYVIFIAYLTMKWVRSSVQEDYENREDKEYKKQQRKEFANCVWRDHIRRQQEKQIQEEIQRQANREHARQMYNMNAINYKWHVRDGRYNDAARDKQNADYWKNEYWR